MSDREKRIGGVATQTNLAKERHTCVDANMADTVDGTAVISG